MRVRHTPKGIMDALDFELELGFDATKQELTINLIREGLMRRKELRKKR